MKDKFINIENILNIIFKITTKSPQIFADFYLRKDISLISRWRNNSIIPKTEDLKMIAEFVINESTEVQRLVIKNELIKLLNNSSLKQEIKSLILEKASFEEFLTEYLSILTVDCDLSEQTMLNLSSQRKEFSSNNVFSIDKLTEEKNSNEVSSNISGDYTGIVKFDMSLNKKANSNTSDNYIKKLIKDINFDEKDINKIKKHFLNKITLAIVLIVFTSFITIQFLNNKPSAVSLGVAPSPSPTTVITPEKKTESTVRPNVSNKNILLDNSPTTTTKLDSDAPKISVKKSENTYSKAITENNENTNITITGSGIFTIGDNNIVNIK